MTEAGKKYNELERKLLMGRVNGTTTEAEDDAFTDQTDDVWWKMTEEETAVADAGGIVWNKILNDGPISPRDAEALKDIRGRSNAQNIRLVILSFIDRGMLKIDDDLKLAIVKEKK